MEPDWGKHLPQQPPHLTLDPVTQAQNLLLGELDLTVELYVGFGEQSPAGTWEDFLIGNASFSLRLPVPENVGLDLLGTATYFEASAATWPLTRTSGPWL